MITTPVQRQYLFATAAEIPLERNTRCPLIIDADERCARCVVVLELLVTKAGRQRELIVDPPRIFDIPGLRDRVEGAAVLDVTRANGVDSRAVAIPVFHYIAVRQLVAYVPGLITVVDTAEAARIVVEARVNGCIDRCVVFTVEAGADRVVAEVVLDVDAIGFALVTTGLNRRGDPAARQDVR